MYFKVVILTALFSVSCGQFLQCPWASTMDCTKFAIRLLCGTDYLTYDNRCDFTKAQCHDNSLHVLGEGRCGDLGFLPTTSPPPGVTTTRPTGPTTTHTPVFLGHDVVLDFFCLELSHRHCPKDTGMVCGDDHVTYDNYCEYEKARCTHRHLKVLNYGRCS